MLKSLGLEWTVDETDELEIDENSAQSQSEEQQRSVGADSQLDPTGPLYTSPTACPTPPCGRPRAAFRRTSAI